MGITCTVSNQILHTAYYGTELLTIYQLLYCELYNKSSLYTFLSF